MSNSQFIGLSIMVRYLTLNKCYNTGIIVSYSYPLGYTYRPMPIPMYNTIQYNTSVLMFVCDVCFVP